MSKRSNFAAILIGSLLACLPVFAQSEDAGRSQVPVQFFGTLATYRFFFTAHQGVEANYGYSLSTATYNFASGQSGVNANQREWTRAYLYRFPLGRIAPFVGAGVGGLTFQPINWYASTQTRAAFVYGAGADLNFTHRLSARPSIVASSTTVRRST